MTMAWTSWSDFFGMGGYALYVWGAVGVSLAALAAEVLALRHRAAGARRAALWRTSGARGR